MQATLAKWTKSVKEQRNVGPKKDIDANLLQYKTYNISISLRGHNGSCIWRMPYVMWYLCRYCQVHFLIWNQIYLIFFFWTNPKESIKQSLPFTVICDHVKFCRYWMIISLWNSYFQFQIGDSDSEVKVVCGKEPPGGYSFTSTTNPASTSSKSGITKMSTELAKHNTDVTETGNWLRNFKKGTGWILPCK